MFSTTAVGSINAGAIERQHRKDRRRAVALGSSLALHVVLLVLAVGSAGGAVVTGGSGGTLEESAITISLAGITGSRQAQTSPDEARLNFLYRKALAEQSELYTSDQKPTAHSNLAKLFDAIEREHGGDTAQDGTKGAASAGSQTGGGQHGRGNRLPQETSQSDSKSDGPGSAASSGGLWGQVEPCWRRIPNQSAVPVTLNVQIDDKGMVAKPPTIVRPDASVPDQPRLIAEARALAAISACLPYRNVAQATGQREFTLRFRASSPASTDLN